MIRTSLGASLVVPDNIDNRAQWTGVIARLVNNLSSVGRSLAELRNALARATAGLPRIPALRPTTHSLP